MAIKTFNGKKYHSQFGVCVADEFLSPFPKRDKDSPLRLEKSPIFDYLQFATLCPFSQCFSCVLPEMVIPRIKKSIKHKVDKSIL